MTAVNKTGRALRYTTPELQSDKGIVYKAIEKDLHAIVNADPIFRNDKTLILSLFVF
jgi:hypothetical protein